DRSTIEIETIAGETIDATVSIPRRTPSRHDSSAFRRAAGDRSEAPSVIRRRPESPERWPAAAERPTPAGTGLPQWTGAGPASGRDLAAEAATTRRRATR